QKINALDQAAPLADWKLPEEFATLRRLLEARMGKPGKREFVQVLRLMETFRIEDVAAAVHDALERGAVGFDAIKHLVLCRIDRRIKAAKFPTVKSLDSFDFAAFPDLNKALVMELARSEYVERRENVIAVGNSGTGKSHIGLGLGLAACQKGLSVGFANAAAA